MRRLLVYALYFHTLASCINAPADTLPALIVDHDDWGGNFTLHIAHTEELSSEKTLYTLVSDYLGKPVGFTLLMTDPKKKRHLYPKESPSDHSRIQVITSWWRLPTSMASNGPPLHLRIAS